MAVQWSDILPDFIWYESVNLGLVTINPQSHKEYTEIHKIPKYQLIRLVLIEIQPFKNVKISKAMYGHPDAVSSGHTFLHKF